jgi:hypothetical protein
MRIEPLSLRTRRDRVRLKFAAILNHIVSFVIRHDQDDRNRCLVCGIVFFNHLSAVGLNTRQLSKLVGLCRSSINSGFQDLGYSSIPMSPNQTLAFMQVFPFFAGNNNEIRQWTVREWHPAVRPEPSILAPAAAEPTAREQEDCLLFGDWDDYGNDDWTAEYETV